MKLPKHQLLVIEKFEGAVRDHAIIGATRKADHPLIENDYTIAKLQLKALIYSLNKEIDEAYER